MGNAYGKEDPKQTIEFDKFSNLNHTIESINNISRHFTGENVDNITFKRNTKDIIIVNWGKTTFNIKRKGVYYIYGKMLDSMQILLDKDCLSNNENICEICFMDLNDEYIFLSCNHGPFHKECIKKWIGISKTCPFCRVLNSKLVIKEVDKNRESVANTIYDYLCKININ